MNTARESIDADGAGRDPSVLAAAGKSWESELRKPSRPLIPSIAGAPNPKADSEVNWRRSRIHRHILRAQRALAGSGDGKRVILD